MRYRTPALLGFLVTAVVALHSICADAQSTTPPDTSPHKVQSVVVDQDVKLEVLDWGGSGPPLIFMSGLGATAHVFDDFASKFTVKHHVFGITRRGFGNSSKPPPSRDNYNPDRLGDDVLAVIAKLGLVKPVLAGHSIAGQEMSSIGTRHPEKTAGLIYLDAGYEYAAFDPKFADGSSRYGAEIEMHTLEEDLRKLPRIPPEQAREAIKEMQNIMPRLQKLLAWYAPQDEVADRAARPELWTYVDAVDSVKQKYGTLPLPVLAIFAEFQDCIKDCADAKIWDADRTVSADAFTAVNPRARVVRLAHARHSVWKSNEADVFHEMNAFMDGLQH